MRDPDRRSALLAGFAVIGGAAAAGVAGCSSGSGSGLESASGSASGMRGKTLPVPSPSAQSGQPAQSGTATSASGAASAPTSGPSAPPAPNTPNAPSAPTSPPAAELDRATSGRQQVALTFHGDGDPKLAVALLKEAESAGAHLTVLAVGRWLGEHPELAKRILDGGHELGNHTETHADITRMSPSAAYAEISACAERLRKLTGSPGRWFRPSQTQHADAMLVEQARRAGYQTVLSYDVDPLDYQDPPSSATAHRFLADVRPGAVVSLHLGHPGTVAALPAMLDGLKKRGLAAVTASELFA